MFGLGWKEKVGDELKNNILVGSRSKSIALADYEIYVLWKNMIWQVNVRASALCVSVCTRTNVECLNAKQWTKRTIMMLRMEELEVASTLKCGISLLACAIAFNFLPTQAEIIRLLICYLGVFVHIDELNWVKLQFICVPCEILWITANCECVCVCVSVHVSKYFRLVQKKIH